MEFIQPYSKYILIILAAIAGGGIALWLAIVAIVMRNTNGIPIAISDFFKLISENKVDEAYSATTENFRSTISKPQFFKLIKKHKFKQYQGTNLGVPQMQGGNSSVLDVTLVLKSGREIPLELIVNRQNKEWKVDFLRVL